MYDNKDMENNNANKTYKVERVQGQAGYEQTIWSERIEAETAAEAIRMATPANDPARDFPVEETDSDFASSQNPEASRRHSDGVISERV